MNSTNALRILILGGNGFFGKILAGKLADRGDEVTLLNRGYLYDGLGDAVERIRADRNDETCMQAVLYNKQWDIIYDQSCYNAQQAQQACNYFKQKTKKYIFTSTQAVYGLGSNLTEEQFNPNTYKFAYKATQYGEAKKQAEAVFAQCAPWPVSMVRFPVVLGYHDPSQRLQYHVDKIFKNEALYFSNLDAKISLIEAEDAANTLVLLADNDAEGPINAASDTPITLREFVNLLEKYTEHPIKLSITEHLNNLSTYSVPRDWYVNTSKLTNIENITRPIHQWLPALIKNCKNQTNRTNRLINRQALFYLEKELITEDFSNKVIVLNAHDFEIAWSITAGLAMRGAKIVANFSQESMKKAFVRKAQEFNLNILATHLQITHTKAIDSLLKKAIGHFTRVDILINNLTTGTCAEKNLWEYNLKEWQKSINKELQATFLCTQGFVKWILKHKTSGRIINISSDSEAVSWMLGKSGMHYVNSGAINTMTQTLATQLENKGITVVGIQLPPLSNSFSDMLNKNYLKTVRKIVPTPDSIVPSIIAAIQTEHDKIHGKSLQTNRFNANADGEIFLNNWNAQNAHPINLLIYDRTQQEIDRNNPNHAFLGWGENLFGPSPKVKEFLKNPDLAEKANYYAPCQNSMQLRQSLSQHYQLPEECFTFGPGSDEILGRILRVFTKPGSEVISNNPTYFLFDRHCDAFGVINRKVDFFKNPRVPNHHLKDIANNIVPQTKLIYLVSPGNPVGIGIHIEDFMEFLTKVPHHIPIILDEAYIEYCDDENIVQSPELIKQTDHCIIGVRTFSKLYGLAGLRIGYAFSSPKTIQPLQLAEPFFGISRLSEQAACLALSDQAYISHIRTVIIQEKKRIVAAFEEAHIEYIVMDSANIAFRPPITPCERLLKQFDQQGIYMTGELIKDQYVILRISTPEVNDKLLEIILSIAKKQKPLKTSISSLFSDIKPLTST